MTGKLHVLIDTLFVPAFILLLVSVFLGVIFLSTFFHFYYTFFTYNSYFSLLFNISLTSEHISTYIYFCTSLFSCPSFFPASPFLLFIFPLPFHPPFFFLSASFIFSPFLHFPFPPSPSPPANLLPLIFLPSLTAVCSHVELAVSVKSKCWLIYESISVSDSMMAQRQGEGVRVRLLIYILRVQIPLREAVLWSLKFRSCNIHS